MCGTAQESEASLGSIAQSQSQKQKLEVDSSSHRDIQLVDRINDSVVFVTFPPLGSRCMANEGNKDSKSHKSG